MVPDLSDDEYRAAIFPALPFGPLPTVREDDQWNQIYFLFGQAMLWAQSYEDGMAQLVVAAEKRWNRSGIPAEKIRKMNLGQLQKEYIRYCHMEQHDHERLAEARRVRNEIAHSFYRRRMKQLQTVEGRDRVIRELHEAIRLFQIERDEMYWLLSAVTGQPLL